MRKINFIGLLVAILSFHVNLIGQTQQAYVNAANSAFQKQDYYSALSFYQEALSFDTEGKVNPELQFQAAEAARMFQSYKIAAQRYEEVLINENNQYPMASFWLAEVYQRMGDYDKANEKYQLYLAEHSDEDGFYTKKAKKEIEACLWAKSSMVATSQTTIEHLNSDINSPYSEFGAIQNGEDILYSSLKFDGKSKTGQSYLISKVLKNNEKGSEIFLGEKDGNKTHIAHTAYNHDKSKIFFTICEYTNESEIRCDIYYSTIDAQGKVSPGVKLPEPINHPKYTSTQPNIGFNGVLDKEILYFVSDRDGGKGKFDIWSVAIDGDKFGDVTNMQLVNTAENDVTPFFHSISQTFYFSSEGYIGYGGLDVYRFREIALGGTSKIENLGTPINSSYNDIYFNLNELSKEALMSSNRIGSYYLDDLQEACCYDIYKLNIKEIELKLNALTFDKNTLQPLNDARVLILDARTNEIIGDITNVPGNDHRFILNPDREYKIVASKPLYQSDTVMVSTFGIDETQEIIKKLYLKPSLQMLEVYTYDKQTLDPLNGVGLQLVDITDTSIAPISIVHNGDNHYLFEYIPNHRYKLTATKDRYLPEFDDFEADVNTLGPNIVRKLFLSRTIDGDLAAFLPVVLYFDNDHPDPRSASRKTKLSYGQTHSQYIQHEFDFIESNKKYGKEEEIKVFFKREVIGQYEKYDIFFGQVLEHLKKGKRFEISIKGYASPRAETKYNLALAQRRVISVRNEVDSWQGGVLKDYIRTKKLKITELSLGETTARESISDVIDNPDQSIYSLEASKERRVEIVDIRVLDNH